MKRLQTNPMASACFSRNLETVAEKCDLLIPHNLDPMDLIFCDHRNYPFPKKPGNSQRVGGDVVRMTNEEKFPDSSILCGLKEGTMWLASREKRRA